MNYRLIITVVLGALLLYSVVPAMAFTQLWTSTNHIVASANYTWLMSSYSSTYNFPTSLTINFYGGQYLGPYFGGTYFTDVNVTVWLYYNPALGGSATGTLYFTNCPSGVTVVGNNTSVSVSAYTLARYTFKLVYPSQWIVALSTQFCTINLSTSASAFGIAGVSVIVGIYTQSVGYEVISGKYYPAIVWSVGPVYFSSGSTVYMPTSLRIQPYPVAPSGVTFGYVSSGSISATGSGNTWFSVSAPTSTTTYTYEFVITAEPNYYNNYPIGNIYLYGVTPETPNSLSGYAYFAQPPITGGVKPISLSLFPGNMTVYVYPSLYGSALYSVSSSTTVSISTGSQYLSVGGLGSSTTVPTIYIPSSSLSVGGTYVLLFGIQSTSIFSSAYPVFYVFPFYIASMSPSISMAFLVNGTQYSSYTSKFMNLTAGSTTQLGPSAYQFNWSIQSRVLNVSGNTYVYLAYLIANVSLTNTGTYISTTPSTPQACSSSTIKYTPIYTSNVGSNYVFIAYYASVGCSETSLSNGYYVYGGTYYNPYAMVYPAILITGSSTSPSVTVAPSFTVLKTTVNGTETWWYVYQGNYGVSVLGSSLASPVSSIGTPTYTPHYYCLGVGLTVPNTFFLVYPNGSITTNVLAGYPNGTVVPVGTTTQPINMPKRLFNFTVYNYYYGGGVYYYIACLSMNVIDIINVFVNGQLVNSTTIASNYTVPISYTVPNNYVIRVYSPNAGVVTVPIKLNGMTKYVTFNLTKFDPVLNVYATAPTTTTTGPTAPPYYPVALWVYPTVVNATPGSRFTITVYLQLNGVAVSPTTYYVNVTFNGVNYTVPIYAFGVNTVFSNATTLVAPTTPGTYVGTASYDGLMANFTVYVVRTGVATPSPTPTPGGGKSPGVSPTTGGQATTTTSTTGVLPTWLQYLESPVLWLVIILIILIAVAVYEYARRDRWIDI